MKITKEQLKKIVREEFLNEAPRYGEQYAGEAPADVDPGDESYMDAMMDLYDRLRDALHIAIEAGVYPEDIETAWQDAQGYMDEIKST